MKDGVCSKIKERLCGFFILAIEAPLFLVVIGGRMKLLKVVYAINLRRQRSVYFYTPAD